MNVSSVSIIQQPNGAHTVNVHIRSLAGTCLNPVVQMKNENEK